MVVVYWTSCYPEMTLLTCKSKSPTLAFPTTVYSRGQPASDGRTQSTKPQYDVDEKISMPISSGPPYLNPNSATVNTYPHSWIQTTWQTFTTKLSQKSWMFKHRSALLHSGNDRLIRGMTPNVGLPNNQLANSNIATTKQNQPPIVLPGALLWNPSMH